MAKARKIKVALFSYEKVRQFYFGDEKGTKHALAEILARRFQELTDHLPPKRRAWTSEDSRMDYFDAVAIVLVYRKRHTTYDMTFMTSLHRGGWPDAYRPSQ